MLCCSIEHGRRVLLAWRNIPWLTQDCETQPKEEWRKCEEKERQGKKALKHYKSTLIHGRHKIRIFSICHKGVAYSFPTNSINPGFPSIHEWAELFSEYFTKINPNVISVYHNANYDKRAFKDAGFAESLIFWCTLISSWMANANEDKGLKARAPFYGRYIQDTSTVDFNDLRALASYAEGDVIVTDEIFQQHNFDKVVRPVFLVFTGPRGESVKEKNQVGALEISVPTEMLSDFDRLFLRTQEFPVLESTIRCEENGVPLNVRMLTAIRVKLDADLLTIKRNIYRLAGKVFNLNAGKEKLAVLIALGCRPTKTSRKTGAPSLDFESMVQMKGQHPIIDLFMEYSKIEKLRSVYVGEDGLEYYVDKRDGCIHPNLNTVGAVTGRFSSSNPNAQQIPAKNDRYGIRSTFTLCS